MDYSAQQMEVDGVYIPDIELPVIAFNNWIKYEYEKKAFKPVRDINIEPNRGGLLDRYFQRIC